ncbi:hypothetical protein M514_23616, partial [Trichuris suis]
PYAFQRSLHIFPEPIRSTVGSPQSTLSATERLCSATVVHCHLEEFFIGRTGGMKMTKQDQRTYIAPQSTTATLQPASPLALDWIDEVRQRSSLDENVSSASKTSRQFTKQVYAGA